MNAVNSIRVKVPALKPLKTAHELRDATVRDYRTAALRAGAQVDLAALERLAISDCNMVDRYNAESQPSFPRAADALAEHREQQRMTVEGEVQKLGGTTDFSNLDIRRAPVRSLHLSGGTDRWRFAKGRVAQICRGATRSTDPVIATSSCEIPHLALELYRLYANVAVRRRMPRPGDEPNPFFGLSDIDSSRLLQRQVEDICDRSTGRLGAWRTPK